MERKNVSPSEASNTSVFWLTSVKDDAGGDSTSILNQLVKDRKIFAFGETTRGRLAIKGGDWVCFYAVRRGIVGHAVLTSSVYRLQNPVIRAMGEYPWAVDLGQISLYLDNPVVIDVDLRKKLDAFKDKPVVGKWSWIVQATHRVSEHDFKCLTRQM